MTSQLQISREGHLGIIALKRPEAINALSREMIDGIVAALDAWRTDEAVRAVLFEGGGLRGFCSGGDVRAARTLVLEGRLGDAEAYFAAEYAMNLAIATYSKPVIALTSGIVMGGGIGIAGHAGFRLTTPEASFAMPEAAIGFVSDVGVNAILGKAPLHRALLFLMSGLPVKGADALALGLADCTIAPDKLAEVRAGIVAAVGTGHPETALVKLMQAQSIDPGEPALCLLADRLAAAFDAPQAGQIVTAITEAAAADPTFADVARALDARSPTSLEAILGSHRAARQLTDIGAVLALDLRLARLMASLPDFAEGVRAVLVDKDQRPRWQPDAFDTVPQAAIDAAISGL